MGREKHVLCSYSNLLVEHLVSLGEMLSEANVFRTVYIIVIFNRVLDLQVNAKIASLNVVLLKLEYCKILRLLITNKK
jgi:hypothetical protein